MGEIGRDLRIRRREGGGEEREAAERRRRELWRWGREEEMRKVSLRRGGMGWRTSILGAKGRIDWVGEKLVS